MEEPTPKLNLNIQEEESSEEKKPPQDLKMVHDLYMLAFQKLIRDASTELNSGKVTFEEKGRKSPIMQWEPDLL